MEEQTTLRAEHKEFEQLNVFVYNQTFRMFVKGQPEIYAYSLASFHNFKVVRSDKTTDVYINSELICSIVDFNEVGRLTVFLQQLLERAADDRGRSQALIINKLFGIDSENDA